MGFRQKLDSLLARVFTRVPLVGRVWGRLARIEKEKDVPWTPITKPLQECRICLITTGGLHLRNDRPFNMEDPEGDPTYRIIPSDARAEDLTVTHNYYDHRDADRDFNILLPLDRLRELVREGFVGELAPSHYSFMGHIAGPRLAVLKERILHELVSRMVAEKPDIAFLTPA